MIYLAAPLFNDRERAYNARLKNIIMARYAVYLPQEDGGLFSQLIQNGMSISSAIQYVHGNDVKALHRCDLLVAVLDGPHVDSGVSFEIGFVRALEKPVIGFHTDSRSELPFGHNPMIVGALALLVSSETDLLFGIEKVLNSRR